MAERRECPYCRGKSRRGGVCRRCQDATSQRLEDLPGWWDDLQTAVVRQAKLQASGGGPSGDQWKWPYDVRASFAAEAIAKTIASWHQFTIDSLDAPDVPLPRTLDQIGHLTVWHQTIARHDRYLEFMDDIYRITGRIMRVVDHPDVKARIEAGPCYLTDSTGQPCTGTVHAYIPTEGSEQEWPPFMGCDQEDEHWWDATRWRRAGEAMHRRQQELERARRLAEQIGGRR